MCKFAKFYEDCLGLKYDYITAIDSELSSYYDYSFSIISLSQRLQRSTCEEMSVAWQVN